jgi:hypothetical protein
LLHTQEELAPRNLLDDTARCLMPFLARGHHSPDEGGAPDPARPPRATSWRARKQADMGEFMCPRGT